MKKLQFILICLFLLINFTLLARDYTFPITIEVIPENPTANDNITIIVSGLTTSNLISVNSNYTIEGNTIFIQVDVYQGGYTVIDFFITENDIGNLPIGNYYVIVNVNYYLNDGFGNWILIGDQTGSFNFNVVIFGFEDENNSPITTGLFQNYPNPFSNKTSIRYSLPKPSFVKIQVFNIRGQLIEGIVDKFMQSGSHSVEWNAKDISSGIYFYKFEAEDKTFIKKMILLR